MQHEDNHRETREDASPGVKPAPSSLETVVELDGRFEPPAETDAAGIHIGRLLAVADGEAEVALDGAAGPVRARCLGALHGRHVGRPVAVMFEGGNPRRPLVLGPVAASAADMEPGKPLLTGPAPLDLEVERVVVDSMQGIVLRCGKASITLTEDGKVLIRGTRVLTRASGVNRILGGSVQIN